MLYKSIFSEMLKKIPAVECSQKVQEIAKTLKY
jgi:hypothetical protein